MTSELDSAIVQILITLENLMDLLTDMGLKEECASIERSLVTYEKRLEQSLQESAERAEAVQRRVNNSLGFGNYGKSRDRVGSATYESATSSTKTAKSGGKRSPVDSSSRMSAAATSATSKSCASSGSRRRKAREAAAAAEEELPSGNCILS